jgi:ferritin-like metal-binding protein YciE
VSRRAGDATSPVVISAEEPFDGCNFPSLRLVGIRATRCSGAKKMAALGSAQDLLAYELKEIHSAERQLSRALPQLMKKVSSTQLRDMLDRRLKRGAELIEEIDDVLAELESPKGRQKNVAAEGLIEDATHHLGALGEDSLVDPLVLASVQKLEHYCIAAWGTAAAIGRLLEQHEAVNAMERALHEGKRFDEELTELAESEINPAMLEDGSRTTKRGTKKVGERKKTGSGKGSRGGKSRGR